MTLADKLSRIIEQQGISKAAFAQRLGVSANYIYILTGESRKGTKKNKKISPSLARLISLEFGCDADWLLSDKQ